jgi:broad specificity phosphatase PhoE
MHDHCLVYLLRHGATAHNLFDPPRMQGRHIDEPLVDLGRRQAADVAAALARKPLAAVYASPMKRALQTATVIAESHGLSAVSVEGVAEADVGRWEDRSWDEIELNDAEAYRAFRADPVAFGYPGGENLGEVAQRVVSAIDQVAAEHMGQHIAIVAHSVVNRLYLGEVLSIPIAVRRKLPQDNCSISIVKWRPQGSTVETINAVHHLASHSPSA